MVAGISSLDNTVLELLTKMSSSNTTNATSDFSSLFSTDDITSSAMSGSNNAESLNAVKSSTGGGSSSESSEDNPMDLNGDGKVTIDEMLSYLSSQQEQLTSGIDSGEDSQPNLLNKLTGAIKGYSSYSQASSLLSSAMSSMLSFA